MTGWLPRPGRRGRSPLRLATRLCSDHGAGAVWVLALTAVLIVVAIIGAQVADLLAARQRAAAAADLGALAGAPAAAYGDANACRAASAVVLDNGATLESCRVEAGELWVVAASRPRSTTARWVAEAVLGFAGPRVSAHAGLR